MRFQLSLMGMELFSIEFAWPARGVYPVPDFMPQEFEFDDEEFENED